MTAATTDAPPAEGKGKTRSLLPLILGIALALAGAAGGFLAVKTGLFGGHAPAAQGAPAEVAEAMLPPLAPMAFVPLPPLVVNLPGAGDRFLRFAGQLEVAPEHLGEITSLVPRIVDVLNGYLRAVEPAEIEDPAALLRLRSQMLRRVQVVAGGDRVRDLLVMEFVVN
jgi:flagellar FliL protein